MDEYELRRLRDLAALSGSDKLTDSERAEYNVLVVKWMRENDPLDSPPPDAGLLIWSGE